jgi:hypothetical protein
MKTYTVSIYQKNCYPLPLHDVLYKEMEISAPNKKECKLIAEEYIEGLGGFIQANELKIVIN